MTDINLKTAFNATKSEKLYGNGRAMPAPAYRRLELARDNLEQYHARKWAWDIAVSAMQKETPATPEAAQKVKDALQAFVRAKAIVNRKPRGAAYVGTWQAQAGQWYCENPDAFFRSVTTAQATGAIEHNGWFDNEHGESSRDGSGLVWGIVARMAGRNGKACFVAGYQVGDSCGAVFDMATLYEFENDAARAGDSMAESCADKEREYKAAWQAGQEWRDMKEQEQETRRETLELLAERRSARALPVDSFPQIRETLCSLIRAKIAEISESREKRETLWCGIPTRLESAFCEGADLESAPV